jgi:hypothetical protein
VVAAERERLARAVWRRPRELLLLFVEASEGGLLEDDLEFEAAVAAAPPADLLELALSGREAVGCVFAPLLELLPAAGVQVCVDVVPSSGLVEGAGSAAERSSARAARSGGVAGSGSDISCSIASRSAR